MSGLRAAALALAAAASLAGAEDAPRTPEDLLWARLEGRLREVERGLDGVLGVAVQDLTNGRTLLLNADQAFPTASSIKLAVLYELYRQAEEGRVDLAERVRPRGPRVAGSGVLQLLGEEVELTVRDLAVLMFAESDNEATNLLIDRVGMERVNARLDGLGLRGTRLRRKMMDLAAARRGEENLATPAELLRLLAAIHEGRGLSAARAADLRKVAAVPKSSDFRAPIPEGVPVLDKPGDLEGVRCVAAVVVHPRRPYAAVVMTSYLREDPDGEAALRAVSEALWDTFDRLGRGAPYGRLIGGS